MTGLKTFDGCQFTKKMSGVSRWPLRYNRHMTDLLQKATDMFSPEPTAVVARGGLLDSILESPRLLDRLGAMPADEKTIEVSSFSSNDFSHPDWKIGHGEFQHETLELNIDDASAPFIAFDSGFIPLRQIANLGAEQSDDIDYRFVGKLGAGGTGVVFQAHQRAVDREVAVKMLRDDLAINPHSRDRFLAEARVIGGLDHPNVIALHEVYTDAKGSLFYSMKRIDGTSWDKQIGELSQTQNIETLLRVADAIRYAHSRGLIHRDIKPENVMLGKFGEVLLADWGLAINVQDAPWESSASHSIGGTPAYMAPELATASAGPITMRTDVYLLGAILFQILTGKPPHEGDTLLQSIHAAAKNVIRHTDVEGELMDIAMMAMSTDPELRYANVGAFVDAIKDQQQHEESSRLIRRALRKVAMKGDNEDAGDSYQNYGVADGLLAEAIERWPDNEKAYQTRKRLQLEFAKLAAGRGDYDLALTIYAAAGESDCDEARQVDAHRRLRDAKHLQVSRYSALFTQSPDAGLLLHMPSGKIAEANQAFANLFGYREDQVVGKRIGELNLWVCPARRKSLVDALDANGSVDDFETQFYHTDGRLMDVLINARVVEVQGESMLVSTIRDISQRKQAETDLKRSRARLRDFQRMAGLATWSYELASGVVTWSNETFALAGRSREDGTPTRDEYFEMIHPDDRASLQVALESAIESGASYELSVRQKASDGQYIHVIARGQPIFDESGKTIEVYGVVLKQPCASMKG